MIVRLIKLLCLLFLITHSLILHPYGSINLVVKTQVGAGFFSEFLKVVGSIIHYEDERVNSACVDWTNQFCPYKDDPHENGWCLYFDPIHMGKEDNTASLSKNHTLEICDVVPPGVHQYYCNEQFIKYDKFLPCRNFVHEKIMKYIYIKKEILNFVDDFYKQNMQGCICIGVHCRHSWAHACEVPGRQLPTLQEYFSEIDALLYANPDADIKIYIASDSHQAMNAFKERYGSRSLCIDAFRSGEREEAHVISANTSYWINNPEEWHKKKPGFAGGVTVLYDCLLLSRCDYLIHTTSNLATASTFFNPDIKSIYLPRTAPCVSCHENYDSRNLKNKFLKP